MMYLKRYQPGMIPGYFFRKEKIKMHHTSYDKFILENEKAGFYKTFENWKDLEKNLRKVPKTFHNSDVSPILLPVDELEILERITRSNFTEQKTIGIAERKDKFWKISLFNDYCIYIKS